MIRKNRIVKEHGLNLDRWPVVPPGLRYVSVLGLLIETTGKSEPFGVGSKFFRHEIKIVDNKMLLPGLQNCRNYFSVGTTWFTDLSTATAI